MAKVHESDIQKYWTERPMILPGGGFDFDRATPDEIIAHVDTMARKNQRWFMTSQSAPFLSRYIDFAQLKGKTVLEIGYGVGWLLNEFKKAGADVYGIDLSHKHYEISSHRFRGDPRVHLQVASAEAIPFEDQFFDFVAAYGVLHHAADDRRCYDEVYRVLKPGGKAFLMLYRKGGPKYYWRKLFRQGILRGGLLKHRFNVEKFIYSVTDAYQNDSPGAPISRHYSRNDVLDRLRKFSRVDLQIAGNTNEWRNLPFGHLPLSNLLGDNVLRRLTERSGAYWMVNLSK